MKYLPATSLIIGLICLFYFDKINGFCLAIGLALSGGFIPETTVVRSFKKDSNNGK